MTDKQFLVLDFIKRFISENGYSPTVREIAVGLSLKSPSTVQEHLKSLINAGMITCKKNKNRTIELLVENEYIKTDIVRVQDIQSDDTINVNTFLLNDYKNNIFYFKTDNTIYILTKDKINSKYILIKDGLDYAIRAYDENEKVYGYIISKMELL